MATERSIAISHCEGRRSETSPVIAEKGAQCVVSLLFVSVLEERDRLERGCFYAVVTFEGELVC